MDAATRSRRHAELWQAGNTRVRRTAVSALVFASVILFNVVEPYAASAPRRDALAALEARELAVRDRVARVTAFEDRLDGISQAVARADWSEPKEDLKRRFALGQVTNAQQEADRTIHEIARRIREQVVAPLDAAVTETGVTGDLARHPATMKQAVDAWEESKLGAPWFDTRPRKDATVHELGETLEAIQRDAGRAVLELERAVEADRKRLKQEQSALATEIDATRRDIQKALDDAIPAWARGLVSVELMVRLYPWILIGLAVYLVGSGLLAARHYRGMAEASGWSREERCDPLLSSPWTLTWRGAWGTAATAVCYATVLLCLGYFLYRSMR